MAAIPTSTSLAGESSSIFFVFMVQKYSFSGLYRGFSCFSKFKNEFFRIFANLNYVKNLALNEKTED
jgi:hypothetical protein